MKTLTLEAPAKINLTLDILGRRTDGYHDMRMVMQAVSLGDTVTVAEAAGGFSLLTEGISLPAGKVTLEQRAADAFFHRLGRPVPGAGGTPCQAGPGLCGAWGRQCGCGGGAAVPADPVRPGSAAAGAGGDRAGSGQRCALLRPGRHMSCRGTG